MFNGATDDYVHALKIVPDYFKTQKTGNKVVNTDPSTLQFVPEYYKTQEMLIKLLIPFLYLFLFLIDIRLKKCVTEVFQKIIFC